MGSKFQLILLDNIAEVIDSRHKTPSYTESGYPMVRVVDIKNGELDLKNTKRVTEDIYEDFSKGRSPQIGDLIISRVGSYGNISYVSKNEKFCLGQNTAFIIPNEKNSYLYYALISPFVQQQINDMAVGAVQKTISLKSIKNLKIPYPELNIRNIISEKLRDIDNRISTNDKINKTLEQMSQTLFKSWFVDFDPAIDNALDAGNPIPETLQSRAELRQKVRNSADFRPLPTEIRSLFPSEFEETELGWVPKGWCIKDFSVIAKLIKGNVKSENICDDIHYIGLEHLERKHIFITNYGNGGDVSSNKSAFDKDDLLFGKLRPYFHKVALAPFSGICSTDILVFRAKENIYRSLMAMYAFTDDFVAYANLRSTGTRMPRAEAKDLLNYKIVLPNKNVLEKFEVLLENYWIKGQLNNYENEKLTNLRDTLLPKLISGELSLEDLPDLTTDTDTA
ncbi:restriction endonuclease subunit S [Escherichia marmotae]|uniref:restriction endonuclease subunit S n=1 Tax=Escherichia marmotae TaxID=1499973 RepID=UPI00355C54BF